MKGSPLSNSRFVVGMILIVIAVLMFLFLKEDYATAGAIGIGIFGLVSVAISKRRQPARLRIVQEFKNARSLDHL